MAKRILKLFATVLLLVLLLLVGLIGFLSVTEYKPEDIQSADHLFLTANSPSAGQTLTVCSWNIGYGGLGKESDFFMDGGSMVNPPSKEIIRKNLEGIRGVIANSPADVWLFQEVDVNSARTEHQNQFTILNNTVAGNAAMAYNYKCPFVPIPLPPIGQVESGVATMTNLSMQDNAQRISLPCPFSWPVRTANIKRCLLLTRLDVENSDKALVFINLHLEAYESGEGRIAQTKQLMELVQQEYEKGNYVIAGGDFNQTFPGSLDLFPIADPEKWTPGVLEDNILPEGWQFAYDNETATCRLLDRPYDENCQLYVIDGFILSPNIQINEVKTVDLGFEYSDHNPVQLEFTLLP